MKRKKIKNRWVDYFNFSARERRGTALLAFIILFEIILLSFLNNYHAPVDPPDPELVKAVLALNASPDESVTAKSHIGDRTDSIPLHPFDPNKMTLSMAPSVGLTEKQSSVIMNYISKGGMFRTKSDFKKMYCISESQYEKLQPYLLLPDSFTRTKKINTAQKSFIVDINTADSTELMKVRGIGRIFASRIVKYRELLGGFYSKEQLKEVWGMKDSLYHTIEPFVQVKEENIFRFVHLNTDTITLLASHPYVRWKLANVIVNYRKQHAFRSVEDVKSIPVVSEEIYSKLYRYLTIN
jgi:competence protein ComEA